MSHTPTPWSLATDMRGVGNVEVHGVTSEDGDVANCGLGNVGKANAKHIVKAVNAHDILLTALREIASGGHWVGACVDKANAALAKVAA
jgi:hypothetical protein